MNILEPKRYFICEPIAPEIHWFRTEQEWLAAIESFDFTKDYLDDGWCEEVSGVFAGELPEPIVSGPEDTTYDLIDLLENHVTHTVEEFDRKERPSDLGDSDYDEEGTYWGDWDYICSYRFTRAKTPNRLL